MATDVVKQIRRRTRRKFSADEKIRIVLEGLRGEIPITEVCRQQGIQPSIYYKWSKAFLDAGKNGLTRDTQQSPRGPLPAGPGSDPSIEERWRCRLLRPVQSSVWSYGLPGWVKILYRW